MMTFRLQVLTYCFCQSALALFLEHSCPFADISLSSLKFKTLVARRRSVTDTGLVFEQQPESPLT